MAPEQNRAIEEWWARHPGLESLALATVGMICVGIILSLASGIIEEWPRWQSAYQYAGGWSLRIEAPTSRAVTVDTYHNQESCEQHRAWDMQRAYYDKQSIPPLSCVPQYQGWRRLVYVWQATRVVRTPTGGSDSR
jgi:hypothetical protein